MTDTPTVDPEFQSIIPPLRPEEYEGLEADILEHGCRQPLDVWEGILLDGHNRFEICAKHGLPYETRTVEAIEDRRDARIWIRTNQLARRNLTPFQRTELELGNAKDREEQAREKQRQGGREKLFQHAEKAIDTTAEVSEAAKVSTDTVSKVRQILKHDRVTR